LVATALFKGIKIIANETIDLFCFKGQIINSNMYRYQFGNNKLLHNYLKLLLVKLENSKNKKILLSNQIEMRFKDFVVLLNQQISSIMNSI
jgi:hypothetical protein